MKNCCSFTVASTGKRS